MLLSGLGHFAKRASALVAAAAMIAALAPGSILAAGHGATVVRGVQQAYGTCGNDDGYRMDGTLTGCWWVDTFDVKPMPAQGTMLATGKEHFIGCLGTVCGTFETTYTYTARFDGQTELHGRCHHPLTEGKGTGGFAGARGELSFTDVVDAEPFSYPYWGNIQLAGDAGASTVSAVTSATRIASAAAAVSAPC